MQKYTATDLQKPTEIFRRATREPVLIQHRHHGEFVLLTKEQYEKLFKSEDDLK